MLTLTHLNEYSVAEAAALLDWSVTRVKVQSHRARKKLRKILGENSSPRNGMKSSKEQIDKIETSADCGLPSARGASIPSGLAATGDARISSSLAGPTAFPPEEKICDHDPPENCAPWPRRGLAVIVGWLILANLDRHDPWITLKPDLAALESHAAFWLAAGDD